MSTGTLSRSQQAKLASEIEANRPTPEWDSVSELKKWKHQMTIKGEKKTLTFDQLVTKYKDLSAEIDFRKKIADEIKEAIEAAVLVSGEERVTCEGYAVTLVTRSGSRKIVPERLLELGVPASTIAAATEVGKESQYVSIKTAKEEKF
jgi:hypothetical protein